MIALQLLVAAVIIMLAYAAYKARRINAESEAAMEQARHEEKSAANDDDFEGCV